MNKYFFLSILLMGFIWSCSDSELITPGDEFQDVLESGIYTVDIDGVFTDFSSTTSANSSDQNSQINGASSANQTISISIPEALSVGVFTQDQGARIAMNIVGVTFTYLSAINEILPFNLTISSVNNSSGLVSGNFSGTVYSAALGETRELTNGVFYEIQFTPTEAGDRIFTAHFNGNLFDFSREAHAAGLQIEAVIRGERVNQNQTLIFSVPGGLAVGTLTEANEVVVSVNMGTTNNPNDIYSNYDAVTDTYLPVSLKINSITDGENGRVIGTFTGTIAKFNNGETTDEIEVTEGKINVPVENP